MKKKLLLLLLAAISVLSCAFALSGCSMRYGDSYESGGLKFEYQHGADMVVVGVTDKNITELKIPSKIKIPSKFRTLSVGCIGDNCFEDCTSLKSVEISSITTIGREAFKDCTSLESVVFPDTDISIDLGAFSGCTSLKSINLPDTARIKAGAFFGCTDLESLTLPAEISIRYSDNSSSVSGEYGFSWLFYDYELNVNNQYTYPKYDPPETLKKITVNGGTIKKDTFSDLKNIEIVIEKEKINNSIQDGVIYDKKMENIVYMPEGLKGNITIPNSVTEIDRGTFAGCTGLESITIPNSVTEIGTGTFDGCTGLENITLPVIDGAFKELFYVYNEDTSKYVYSAVPKSLKKVTVNGGIITKDTFRGLKNIEITVDKDNPNNSVQDGVIYDKEKKNIVYVPESVKGNITIASGITVLDEGTFENCAEIESITLPNTLMEIGKSAFKGCAKLKKINIPQRVIAIPDNAFSGCTGLEEFDIPKTVTSIGKSAFSGCKNLETLNFKDCSTLTSVGEYAFKDCAVTDINLPYTESVGKGAFYNCHLESLDLSRVTEIGDNSLYCVVKSAALPAFAFKYIHTSSLVGATVTSGNIGQSLFKDCKNLVRVTLNNDITEIGSCAFQSCVRLKEINLPESLEEIGYSAFENCCSLVKLNLPSGLTNLGSSAFDGCNKLIEIVNSSSLNITAGATNNGKVAYYAKNVYKPTAGNATHLSDWAYNRFYADGKGSYNYYLMGMTNVSLTELELGDGVYIYGGEVAYEYAIYDYAFAYENLTSVTIYNCVTEIGDYAFAYCERLTDINFKGTKAQWNAIQKSANWDTGSENYTIHCTDGDISK